MNPAQTYVATLYARFPGRVPVKVGLTLGFGAVYPLVFEDASGVPIGLVGCSWSEGQSADFVQVYHISAFKPRTGAGTKILQYLCDEAYRLGVKLYVQAQPQYIDIDEAIDGEKLQSWYRTFGFRGSVGLTRVPHAI